MKKCLLPFLLIALLANPLYPCSETYITPVFQYKHAPENPFENFARGKIGILKPTYRRVVLFAAYRFLNNGSFSDDEQKALVEVWNAEFRNEEPVKTNSDEIIKKWLEKRREVFKDEEDPPSIYVEKQWGGYAFFPNCHINAFETSIETLSSRISSYGGEDKNVSEWLKGQDAVFSNCAGGKTIPPAAGPDLPVWLIKDRDYQIAAAEFYSLNFAEAKRRFEQIAVDYESVWRETAEYLVGRTLIRQASFTNDTGERIKLYEEAQNRFALMRGNKFYDSAQKFINLVKIRTRPEERTSELARSLLFQQNGEQLRQDLIDYTWLLDKFETEALKTEEKRKEDAEIAKFAESDRILRERISADLAGLGVSVEVTVLKGEVTLSGQIPSEKYDQVLSKVYQTNPRLFTDNLTQVTDNGDGSITYQGGDIDLYTRYPFGSAKEQWEGIERGELLRIIVSGKNSSSSIVVEPDATDEEIIERFGTDEEIQEVREAIKTARAERIRHKFDGKPHPDYEGGYNGEEKISLPLLPEFLLSDDLTDWLFTFQTEGENAYLHALEKWRRNRSDLWLTNALVKANKNSKNINEVLEAARKTSQNSMAFPTVAYHLARIYIEQEKIAQARSLLDNVLHSNLDLPISSRNEFAEMRMKIAGDLDEFLKNSTRKAFTYADYSTSISMDELIQEQKALGNEAGINEFKTWEKREMFDERTVKIINEHFPLSVLLEAQRSPELPLYLREKLAIVIWTRATILEDDRVLQKIAPELISFAPEAREYLNAKTPDERRFACLFVIYHHAEFVPFLESGIDQKYGTFDEALGWWCALNDFDYDEKGNRVARSIPPKPAFLTRDQSVSAQKEIKTLIEIGSAPDYLAANAKEWFKRAPKDNRLPEVLFQASQANESFRYGCGNFSQRVELMDLLFENFPESSWTRKLEK